MQKGKIRRKKKARSVSDIIRVVSAITGSILLLLAIAAIIIKYYRLVSKH